MRWKLRFVASVGAFFVTLGILHLTSPGALAYHPNRYAVVSVTTYSGSQLGGQGDIWTGAPSPLAPPGGFTNQTIWAVNTGHCGGVSWVEAGWTIKGDGSYRYKFIYKVPGTNSCLYTEALSSAGPKYYDIDNWRMEWCSICGSQHYWLAYRNGSFFGGVLTGWKGAHRIDYGGEAGGEAWNIGMHGAVNNMKYKVSSYWFSAWPSWELCSYGYSLLYNGSFQNIYDWGYSPPGSCP